MVDGENRTNEATAIITSTIAVLLAVSSFEHGLFESLQGFRRTDGFIIQAIGESIRWWKGGTEEAFTIIPNYLISGMVAMALSLVAMFWSIKYMRTRGGARVFILLFLALTLVGGGIGHIPFFVLTWAFATRIDKPLTWWTKRKAIRPDKSPPKTWLIALPLFCVSWLIALEIAIFGYFPGESDPDRLLYICWSFLLAAMLLIVVAFVLGLLFDARKRKAA
jgi:hypothetical protein